MTLMMTKNLLHTLMVETHALLLPLFSKQQGGLRESGIEESLSWRHADISRERGPSSRRPRSLYRILVCHCVQSAIFFINLQLHARILCMKETLCRYLCFGLGWK